MPKGYWVTTYRSIKDPDKLAAYAKLAPVALAPFGVKYIVRGMRFSSEIPRLIWRWLWQQKYDLLALAGVIIEPRGYWGPELPVSLSMSKCLGVASRICWTNSAAT